MTRSFPAPTPLAFSLAFALILLAAPGCSTFQLPQLELPALPFSAPNSPRYTGTDPGFELDPTIGEKVYHAVREAKNRNAVVLQVVGDSSPLRVLPLPSDGHSVSISQLLKQAEVCRQIGSIKATLYRPAAGSIAGLPMEIKMADDGKQVRPESDYALRVGDRLRVEKAVSPAVGGLVEGILGI